MVILRFPVAELKAIVALVEAAGDYEHEAWGVKRGPGLMIVGDAGIYIMGTQPDDRPVGVRREVVYAIGANPDVDADFYENKRAWWGGDDGTEYIALADAQAWIVQTESLGLTKARMEISAESLVLV